MATLVRWMLISSFMIYLLSVSCYVVNSPLLAILCITENAVQGHSTKICPGVYGTYVLRVFFYAGFRILI